MRVMAYLGALISLFALWGAWLIHRGKLGTSKWFLRAATWAIVTPFLMNTAGWLLTENGRQPWIVQGLMLVKDGVSASVSSTEIVISLIFFVVLYSLLGVVDGMLMFRFGRKALGDGDEDEHALPPDDSEPTSDRERVPALTY
jgi:cytochrome bd-type quinol oxidase subunit 1